MRQVLISLSIALLFVSAPACSTPKPSTTAAVQGNKTIATLKDLSSMYEKKSLPGFMRLVSENYKDRKAFAASLESTFSKYETVHFTIQYTRMFIEVSDKGMTRATFNWESDWQTAGGSLLKNSGRATFLFEPKTGELAAIDGKNPFLPQAVDTRPK